MKLQLKRPLKVGEKGEPITELVFRERICAGDYRGIKLSAFSDPLVDDYLKIAGRLTSQPDAVLNDLSEEDLAAVVKVVSDFRAAGQTTATTESP